MSKIVLEFESLKILRPKKRWKLYLVVVAEDPSDPDKTLITTLPADDTITIDLTQSLGSSRVTNIT